MLQTAVDLLLEISVIIIDHVMNNEVIIVFVGVALTVSVFGLVLSSIDCNGRGKGK